MSGPATKYPAKVDERLQKPCRRRVPRQGRIDGAFADTGANRTFGDAALVTPEAIC